jgi:hypothetical protein
VSGELDSIRPALESFVEGAGRNLDILRQMSGTIGEIGARIERMEKIRDDLEAAAR